MDANNLRRLGVLPPTGPLPWRFRPLPATTVVFDSAPAATRYLADLQALRAEALEITPEGFRRFRLHLG